MAQSDRPLLIRQGYRFTGRHSAVKICMWTRNSIRGNGVCYKQQFYGIDSHRCVQMSPSIGYCQNRCIFCWRPTDQTKQESIPDPDEPALLIEDCIAAQRQLLTGFRGNDNIEKKVLDEAWQPRHFAISLSGEPTLYPKLNELIRLLHDRGLTSFVVTNGMEPQKLRNIEPPTQLYLSVDAPEPGLFERIDRPLKKDGWKRLMDSLSALKTLGMKTRTCLRLTCMEGINMASPELWAKAVIAAEPWFVELKGYMYVGCSKARMSYSNMPRHERVREFAEQVSAFCGYDIIDEHKRSSAILLAGSHGKKHRLIQ